MSVLIWFFVETSLNQTQNGSRLLALSYLILSPHETAPPLCFTIKCETPHSSVKWQEGVFPRGNNIF